MIGSMINRSWARGFWTQHPTSHVRASPWITGLRRWDHRSAEFIRLLEHPQLQALCVKQKPTKLAAESNKELGFYWKKPTLLEFNSDKTNVTGI